MVYYCVVIDNKYVLDAYFQVYVCTVSGRLYLQTPLRTANRQKVSITLLSNLCHLCQKQIRRVFIMKPQKQLFIIFITEVFYVKQT